jgi:hypothetical protein
VKGRAELVIGVSHESGGRADEDGIPLVRWLKGGRKNREEDVLL